MAKAKESYEEWKKRKEQEGTLPASTTQRSATSAGSSYKPKESYEEWKARKEGKTSSNNLITSFLTDSRAYLSSAQKEYDSLNYQTGKSTYVKRMTDAERLKARGRQIQQYIDRSGNSSEYADLKKYLEEFEKSADNVLDAFRSSADFYGQFESEEKYNEYAAYQKDREEKSVFDLDAGQKEIAAMEQELAELKRQKSTDDSVKSMQNMYAGSTYAAAQGDIKSDRDLKIREMEQQLSSKKQYMNDAKRIQDGITLSSVSGNDDFEAYKGYVSTKNDSVRGQFGMGYDDLTYEYINGEDNGMRQSIINKAVSYDADTEKFFSYDHMTPDQIAIYNYHYAKDGKEAAEKYLNSIQETLNDKAATERFEKMKGITALELVFGLEAGLDQFQSGVKNLFNTNDDYIPQTATQMVSGMVREDLADDGFNFWYNFKDKEWQGTILGNSVGQVAYDAITTSANMAPSILASIAADFILPGSGAYVGSGLMGASAAGNAYQEALNEGYDKNQARGYGLLVGASEIVMEKVLGGISAVGGNALGKYLTRNVSAADTALKMIGKRLGASALSEFTEEYLQEVLTPVFQNIMLDTNNEVKLVSAEALYSGILGALTAGIMEGPTTIGGEVRTNRTGKQLKAAGVSAQRLADIGKTFAADTVAYQLAGKVDENTNAYTMGRLFYEIGATMTEQNVNDITEALVAKGWDRGVANRNARVMAAIVEGENLTNTQAAIIAANDELAEAMKTTIVDPNATWFQRNNGYNDIAMTLAQKMTAPKPAKTKQSLPGQDNAVASEQADTAEEVGTEETPAPSRVQSITRVQGEDVTVKLEDGSEVSIKDADLDPNDGVMIETIARIDGISAEDANYIFNALKAAPGARADFAARGAEEAYRYGYYGFDNKYITEHGVFANSLTETQRKTIYEKGRLARQTKVDSKNATAAKKDATTEKSSTDGRVHFDGDRTKLNSRRKASLSALDKIAEITGLQVYVFTSYLKGNKRVYLDENGVEKAAPNGWYDPSDNSIHIDLNAGANGEGTMLFTLAHELTHHIRKWSPTKFKTLADFLMQEYGKKGVNVDALVREQMAKAKRNGRTISYDTAYEEMVADSMEMMLSDGNVLNRLEKLKARDKDLWFEIKDFINKLADKIRRVYKYLTPGSDEAMIVADMGKAVYKLQELFAEGLMEASENYQASLTPGVEGTIVNQNGYPVAHSTADGTIQLSMRTYEEEGREAFRKYLQKCVSSKKLTKAEMQDMLDGIEEIYGICKEFKDKYAPFSSWSDAAVVRDTHGKPVFSVVTPNGDYNMNLDFSLVCKKRRTLDAVFNEMARRGIIDDFELGQKSVVKINEIIRKYGLETACALCFVDAKRFRQASMADQFTRLYNELVESLVPEDQRGSIDHFNFSGYATIKKVEGGIDTWDNSKLDFSHINHVMKTYGDGTVEYKAAKYIKTHAEGRKLLLRGDFMSSQGFDAVKTQNQDILKLYNSKKGTGGPKAAFGDVQYLNEIIQKSRWWTPKKAYEVGGIRIQSFSDYVPRMVFDYVQMIYDLAATKLPAHAYTKEALFVKQFGLTGIKINMSLIPAIAEGGIAPGLDASGNYVWAGESFDFETAKEIQNAEGYTENCGTICVGVSYKHIVKLLGDPNIRMVIPYHKSGLNPIVAHMNKIAEFTDYTTLKTNPGGCQNTIDKNGSKVEVDFNFNETLRKTGDPKASVRQYLDWCSKHEYTPRFAEFAWHENYYKLIEDFTLYDKDGKYVPQREVRAVFPKADSAFGSMKDLIQEGLQEDAVVEGKRDQNLSAIVDEIQRSIPKTEAEIADEQVAQADRDLEAEEKYSDRNSDGRKGMDDSEISAIQNIGRISVNAFASRDIKATEKLAKRYWEEMGVKSPFFRAWFGDWRVNDQTQVQIADRKGDTRGVQHNDDTGWDIAVSGQVFNETKSHRGSANKNAQPYLPYINDIVRKAVLLDSYGVGVGKAKSDNSLLMHSMYAVADIGNGPEVLKLYVEEMNNPVSDLTTKRSYQLQNIEKAFNASVRVQGQTLSSLTSTLNAVKIVADLFAAVKQYDTTFSPNPVSKVVNIDGVPKEMYHGTSNSGFTIFNTYGGNFGLFGKGSYFTDNPEVADSYTRKGKGQNPGVYGVYLSIKNPLDMDAKADLKAWKKAFEDAELDVSYLNGVVSNEDAFRQLKENLADEGYLRWEAEDMVTELIEGMGYDGITHIGGGRYGTKDGPKHRVYIAFEPEQIKSSTENIGTFDGNNPDIRYQDRDTESVSNRSLLANAFESVAQNETERNRIREYRKKISQMEEQERKLGDLNQQIKELSFSKGPRDTAKIKELREEAIKITNRINIFDKQLIRLEASAPLQAVLDREKKKAYKRAEQKGKEALDAYREKATKTQRELLDRWQESRKRGIESREKTAMRHKIKDVVNDLNQYLLKGTKDRHVPIGLQKAVAEALNAVNMDTVGAEERIAKLNEELLKARTPEEILEISKKIEHIREMGDKMDERLKKLKAAYDEFINSDDPLIANSHDDAVSAHMMRLIVRVGDTPLRDMTLSQLQDVYDVYKVVLATIRNANKSFKDNKNRDISTRASQVMAEIDSLGVKRGKRPAFMSWIEKFGWDGLKPVYAMEHIGSRGLIEAYNNVRAGEDTWAKDIVEAREFYLEKFKKYKYDSWNFEKKYKFTSTTGKDFELTLDQIMSLYAYSKRDQAEDHLKYGGIVFDPKTEVVEKTKHGIRVKYNVANATAYNISEETLADIISKLTPEQKGFVDEMQTYLSDVMGAKGNEVSLAMYDIKLFREKHYFPLKSAQQYMARAKEQAQGEVKVKNSGFSKETKPHAKNPIVLSSFMDVWANHVNEMSMYHAFVLPMEDFYRIYNYTTPSKNESMPTEGVNAYIENAYGSAAIDYIDQMLKDLNGGARTDSRTGFINKMMGKFKKGAVFASLSVVVQQPSAIARAAALVDTKYFIGPKVDHKRHKQLWDEVKQYAPVAIIKEMGYFDTNMGKSTQDFIMGKEYSGIKEQAKALFADSNFRDEILSKLPALADEVAWCGIWEAVKRETNAKYPSMDTKSEAFLQKVGERFTEVITKTQVYDSVLARSANMRSKDTGMKMATAFMAEPTTSINMIADALLKGKRGDRNYARTAIGAVIASQIFNSILVSFVYAARDDDEEETYWEKYIGSVTGEILDGLNPAEYIPFIKDIVSIVKGYDVERSDMAVISDLWNAIQSLKKDDVSVYRKVEGFAGSIAQIFGLPVKNIMRETRAVWQTIVQPSIDRYKGVEREKMTKAGIGYAMKSTAPKWMGGGDVSNQQQLYDAYLNGDAAQMARVKGRFKDQSAINSAIRKALRENDPRIREAAIAWNASDLDAYMRIAKAIIAEKHFVQDDVVLAIRAEANELSPDEGTTSTSKAKGLFTAEKFAEAIAQGDQAMANAVKVDIIQTEQKNGKTAEEAEKSFNSSAKTKLKEMFLAGDISEQKAISALTTYCGADESGAMADVQYWVFKQDYPDVYADDSWFDSYFEKVANSGIDVGVYMEYRNAVSGITGKDMKEKRMDIIDSLPITSAQKDALYYAEGWAESKLNEAPWH